MKVLVILASVDSLLRYGIEAWQEFKKDATIEIVGSSVLEFSKQRLLLAKEPDVVVIHISADSVAAAIRLAESLNQLESPVPVVVFGGFDGEQCGYKEYHLLANSGVSAIDATIPTDKFWELLDRVFVTGYPVYYGSPKYVNFSRLDPRLKKVAQMIVMGLSDEDVALGLNVSVDTAHQYAKEVLRSCGGMTRKEFMLAAAPWAETVFAET